MLLLQVTHLDTTIIHKHPILPNKLQNSSKLNRQSSCSFASTNTTIALLDHNQTANIQLSHYDTLQTKSVSVKLQKFVAGGHNLFRIQSCRCFASVGATNALSDDDGNQVLRISRKGRIGAQKALCDYLHSTRDLDYTDAEHISKNSPIFLKSLLSKVKNDEDVYWALTRYFRYYPINEFEPFLESLGLKQKEIYRLLPRNVFCLADDAMLLENYCVLCNYGVPRSKIGKIYRETPAMFRYGPNLLSAKLRAFEKLGLSMPTVIKLVICCPALFVGESNVYFLLVLDKLKGFGVELDLIRGCLSDKNVYNWKRMLEMLKFLGMMGSDEELERLIREHPKFVFAESGKKIYVLVAALLKLGFGIDETLVFFGQYPHALTGNFTKNLWNSVQFLSQIGMETSDIAGIVSKHAYVLGDSTCKPPKVVLESLNLSAKRLCEIIKNDPDRFSDLVTRRKMSSRHLPKIKGTFLKEKTTFLQMLGYVENSDEMAKAVKLFRGRGDQLQERFDCLVNAGIDCNRVSDMIKQAPQVLNQSRDVIQLKLDYLLNYLDYPIESFIAFPNYLSYNMEKIKLRLTMYRWLKENGAKMANSTAALASLLACADARFVRCFVNLHPKGQEEWERLKSSSSLV